MAETSTTTTSALPGTGSAKKQAEAPRMETLAATVSTPGAGAAAAAAAVTTADASTQEDWEIQRDHAKQQGDNAFRMGGFKTAIDHYTSAIELDPEFLLAYSNRSAAYLKNSEKSKALRDAEKATQLDPKYAKGWSRLAAALHSLRRWYQALEVYQRVLSLDPSNAVAKKGVQDCQTEVDKMEAQRKQFEEEEQALKGHDENEEGAAKQAPTAAAEDEEEDDLLNDFFEDVEEVTKKKSEPKPEMATNNVKNEKVVLGTAKDQMDRLLHPNHEWRNLNPFSVLKLSHTATEDDIARRYKALSLMLHPDKNMGDPRAQQAFDEVKKAKTVLLGDPDRARHSRMLVEEGIKEAQSIFKKNPNGKSLEELEEIEVMRIFAQVEQKRREVEDRERKFEQRTQQQEDAQEEKERNERQFDKSWRREERVHKRVGNWRDFAQVKKKKRKVK